MKYYAIKWVKNGTKINKEFIHPVLRFCILFTFSFPPFCPPQTSISMYFLLSFRASTWYESSRFQLTDIFKNTYSPHVQQNHCRLKASEWVCRVELLSGLSGQCVGLHCCVSCIMHSDDCCVVLCRVATPLWFPCTLPSADRWLTCTGSGTGVNSGSKRRSVHSDWASIR